MSWPGLLSHFPGCGWDTALQESWTRDGAGPRRATLPGHFLPQGEVCPPLREGGEAQAHGRDKGWSLSLQLPLTEALRVGGTQGHRYSPRPSEAVLVPLSRWETKTCGWASGGQ